MDLPVPLLDPNSSYNIYRQREESSPIESFDYACSGMAYHTHHCPETAALSMMLMNRGQLEA